MSKIKSLIIVNQQGTSAYYVGNTYNGLVLQEIIDDTISGDDVHVPHFKGFTDDKQLVFEAINAPIDVAYCAETITD